METPDSTPTTETTIFELLGGESKIQSIVDRFYDLMDLEPQFKELRATHAETLDSARQKLFWFLCGWLGGPAYYFEKVGHPMLRARHLPFKIGIKERDQWVLCMAYALQDNGVTDPIHSELMQSFFNTADWMRNTET